MGSLLSGVGTAKSRGSVTIRSADAGTNGVSGALIFSTGTTSLGSSGAIKLTTGQIKGSVGTAGPITLSAGSKTTTGGGGAKIVLTKVPWLQVEVVQVVQLVQ